MTREEFEELLSEIHFFYTSEAIERMDVALAEFDRLNAEVESLKTTNDFLRIRDLGLIKWCYEEFNHSPDRRGLSEEDAVSCLVDWINEKNKHQNQ